jgi:serine/threonine protein kinase
MRPQDPFIGRDILNGQFQILQKIGSGGMGAVYKALQPEMNRMVGVKILHPKLANRKDLVSRFRREARAMSQLTHPNTVKVFLYGELEDGSLYIIMEFLEGKNLNQTVRADGPFAMERALPVLIQSCGALDEAHKAGIIHRDLKPENIFLVQSGTLHDYAKVLDFGLAKVGERQMRPGSVILTQEGMVFGTPEFMSPEQAQGKPLTPASDIYSLAVILYEVLTGKLPFDAKSAMDYIQLHVTGRPTPLNQRVPGRTFPQLLEQIIDRALAKRPEDRFNTAAEFATAMQYVLQGATQLPPQLARIGSDAIPTNPAGQNIAAQVRAAAAQQQQQQQQQQRQQPQQQQAYPQQQQQQASPAPAPVANGPAARGAMAAMNQPASTPRLPQPQSNPGSSLSGPAGVPKTNVGLLIGVALGFLALGVLLAVVLMKFVMH